MQWWVDSISTVVVKAIAMSQLGSQDRLGTVLVMAVAGERVPIVSLSASSRFSRGRKCQKVRHLMKRLINILCVLCLSKLAFGECSEVCRALEAKTHVGMDRSTRHEPHFWKGVVPSKKSCCSTWHSNVQSQGLLQNVWYDSRSFVYEIT